jgi:hypothetical protein
MHVASYFKNYCHIASFISDMEGETRNEARGKTGCSTGDIRLHKEINATVRLIITNYVIPSVLELLMSHEELCCISG